MAENAAAFSDGELAAAQMLFPGYDVQLHDGTLVIARPPDAAARFATDVISRSLHEYVLRSAHLKIEQPSEIRFDADNVRRYSVALWDTALRVPTFVVVVLRLGDQTRWGRGKVNRALELGVSRGLLVDPKRHEAVMFEGIERTTVDDVVRCDMLPDWSLRKTAIFQNSEDSGISRGSS